MSPLTSWLASPSPEAAVELSPERVTVATLTSRGGRLVVPAHVVEPLPAGAVVPSLLHTNIADPAAVAAGLRAALDRLGSRPRRVALVIPDLTAKVSLVRFEQLPPRREDLDQLVRWQLRKSTPFPIEDASVTYTAGARALDGHELLTVVARREVVREYESVCEAVGAHAGLVDVTTLSVLNLFLVPQTVPASDTLVLYMRPDHTSLAILRGEHVIFYRNRPEGDDETLADLVHQTSMYYEDRLAGQGFARVFVGGSGRTPAAFEATRASLEERLGVRTQAIDPSDVAASTEHINLSSDQMDVLAPLVGILARSRQGVAA